MFSMRGRGYQLIFRFWRSALVFKSAGYIERLLAATKRFHPERMKTVAPFQGPIFALILPWASRKAARPRLLNLVLPGPQSCQKRKNLSVCYTASIRDALITTSR